LARILIASADRELRATLARAYRVTGHSVVEALGAAACMDALGKKPPDALILDPRLPGLEASRLLRNVRRNPALAEMRVSLLAHDMDAGLWEFLGRQFFDLVVEEAGAEAAGVLAAGESSRTPTRPRAKTRKAKTEVSAAPRRILLVEDEPTYALLLGTEFQAQGWKTASVESGEAALEHLARGPVDAVLSDVNLPGMDGCALAFALLERFPAVKVVLMTGLPKEKVPKMPPRVPLLPKPISVRQLMAAMRFL
jgi:DNA-binding response OmpR family regulator